MFMAQIDYLLSTKEGDELAGFPHNRRRIHPLASETSALAHKSLITRPRIIAKISTFRSKAKKGLLPESFCISIPFL